MTRPIEAVVAEAQRRLESSGRLDLDAFISANPEHADELRELLPVMAALHTERQWQQVSAQSRAFANNLFGSLTQSAREIAAVDTTGPAFLFGRYAAASAPAAAPMAAPPSPEPPAGESSTVGDLFARERSKAGLSVEEQARRSGMPVRSLEQLARSDTPLSELSDNAALKRLAAQAAAPFGALAKEVRRLLSLDALSGMNGQVVFTRDTETSSEAERQALLEQVKKSAHKPPEEKPRE